MDINLKKPVIPSFEDQLYESFESEQLGSVLSSVLNILKTYHLKLSVIDVASYAAMGAVFSRNQSLQSHIKGYLQLHHIDLLMRFGGVSAKMLKENGLVSDFVAKVCAKKACNLFQGSIGIGISGFCLDMPVKPETVKGIYLACFIKNKLLYNSRFIPLNKHQFSDQKEYLNQVVLSCFMVIKEVLYKHVVLGKALNKHQTDIKFDEKKEKVK